MALTLIRRQQIRTFVNGATDENDIDQLSGADLLINQDGTESGNATDKVSDLVSDATGKGASLVKIKATGNPFTATDVQGALEEINTEAGQYLGDYATVALLNSGAPPASYSGKTALVYNTGDHTEDGLYVSNGTIWEKKGSLLDYVTNQYEMAAPIDMNGNDIIGLPSSPSSASAAASKTYVDSLIAGHKWRDPVHYKADIVVLAHADLPGTDVANADKYSFCTTEDSNNGLLFQANGSGAWPAIGSPVSATSGELLMLNGGHLSISNEVEDDDIFEYGGDSSWDYDNTYSRKVETGANDTRIYSVDDNGYTYDSDESKWVLADATGGTVGDRNFSSNNYVTDFDTITLAIGDLDTAIYNTDAKIGDLDYTDGLLLTDSETVTQSLEKLNQLGATTTGNGASKIGIFDTDAHYTGTDVEAALKELGDNLYVKGWYGYRQGAGTIAAEGEITFANNSPTISVNATAFPGISTFMDDTGTPTNWGTDSNGNFSAQRLFAVYGIDLQVEVDGTVQPVRYLTWNNSTNILTIKLDGDLRTNDFVVVRIRRNGYSG